MSIKKQPEETPQNRAPRTKEEALARLVQDHPERVAQMLREVLQGRDPEK